MTQTHQMPPWKPVAGCGEFADMRGISQAEIDTIAQWVNNGAPEGNRADLPTPRDFSSGWTLGQPDLALSYKETFTPPNSGDTYRCFPLPTNVPPDTYVSAIDVHPGDRKTVHHVIAFIDKTGASEQLDAADPAPGYTCFGGPGFDITDPFAATLGGWAPGTIATRFPEEVGFWLPPNARVVLQVHYHPHDANPQPDKTEIGIYFAKKKPQKRLLTLPLINTNFTIPPNDSNYKVTAALPICRSSLRLCMWAIYPHMHLLGRSMNVQMTPRRHSPVPDQHQRLGFQLAGDVPLQESDRDPAADKVLARGSLRQLVRQSCATRMHRRKPVSWGEQTTDEMCIAFLAMTLDSRESRDDRQARSPS